MGMKPEDYNHVNLEVSSEIRFFRFISKVLLAIRFLWNYNRHEDFLFT